MELKINHKLNTFIFLLPSLITALSSIIALPFLTKKLDLEDFGYFYLCLIILNFCGSFTLLGGTITMARMFHDKPFKNQQIFMSNLFFLILSISSLISIFVFILWDPIVSHYLISKKHLYILMFVLILYGFQTCVSEILTIKNKPLFFALFMGCQSVFGAIINIYLIRNFNFGVDTLFYSILGSNIVASFFIFYILLQYVKFLPSVEVLKEISKEYKIAISGFFENLFIFFERNLINKLFGLEFFTLFNYAKSYESNMLTINKAIVRGIYSSALTEFKKRKKFSYCKKSIDYILLVVSFFGLFFSTIGYDFLSIISNDKFSESAYLVSLLCLVRIFSNTNVAYNITILVNGKIKSLANVVFYDKLSLLILLIFLVPLIGLNGLVISYILSAIILKIYFIKTSRKFFNVPFLEENIFLIFCILSSVLLISINFADDFYSRLNLFIITFLLGLYYFRFEILSFFSYCIAIVSRK